MEYALREKEEEISTIVDKVLILVLMEYALRDLYQINMSRII
jgi:hypothetical protein